MDRIFAIRKAVRGDATVLVEFNAAMALETEGMELDRAVLAAGVLGIFEVPERGFYLVAENESGIVGSLMVTTEWSDWRNGDFWWVQSVFVRPEFRKQGVFGLLYERVRGMARQADRVCGCRLYVEKENEAARAAYRRRGFSETPYRLYEDAF